MKTFEEKKFNIPELKGISQKTTEEHLKLYSGYVKNANLILAAMADMTDENALAIAEMRRRFSFEFNGMRNHEVYFAGFEGGPRLLGTAAGGASSSPL